MKKRECHWQQPGWNWSSLVKWNKPDTENERLCTRSFWEMNLTEQEDGIVLRRGPKVEGDRGRGDQWGAPRTAQGSLPVLPWPVSSSWAKQTTVYFRMTRTQGNGPWLQRWKCSLLIYGNRTGLCLLVLFLWPAGLINFVVLIPRASSTHRTALFPPFGSVCLLPGRKTFKHFNVIFISTVCHT